MDILSISRFDWYVKDTVKIDSEQNILYNEQIISEKDLLYEINENEFNEDGASASTYSGPNID